MSIEIRREEEKDFRIVEEITRDAFWDLYFPGCNEHFLVHKMRNHPDFIKELDFVAVKEGKVVGNIVYAKSYLLDENDERIETVTFGPVCIHPLHQREKIGSKLINHSMKMAEEMGFNAVVIFGNPSNYCSLGFKSSKTFNVATPDRKFKSSMLVKELKKGALSGGNFRYFGSEVYNIDPDELESFEATFEKRKKGYNPSQELFSILSKSYIE